MSASGGDLVKTSDLEARLENAERQMELLLRSVPDAVVTIDESHVIQSFNVVAEEIFGYQASEVIGKPLEMLIPEQLRAKHQQHLDGFARDEATVRRMDGRLEISGRHKDGTTFPAEAAIVSTEQPDGRKLMTAILRDVTERRSADELYRTLVNESDDGIVILQGEIIVFANPAAQQLIGYPPGETINWVSLIPAEDREVIVANNRARVEGKDAPDHYPATLIRKDGQRVVAEIKPKAIQYEGKPAVLIFLRDLTQRNEMERANRERGERLAMLFNESTDAVLVVRAEADLGVANIVDHNDRALEMLGYSAAELSEVVYRDLVAPGELENAPIQVDVLDSGGLAQAERRVVRGDGAILIVDARSRRLSDGSVIVSLRDITAEREAERTIRDRDERLRVLFDAAQDPILVLNQGDISRFIDFNQAALDLFGYTAAEFRTLGYADLVVEGELDRDPIPAVGDEQSWSRERRFRRRDGSIAIIEVRAKRVGDTLSFVWLRDITELRQAERDARERGERLSMLFNESADAIIVAHPGLASGRASMVDVNDRVIEMFGYSAEELHSMEYGQLMVPGELERSPIPDGILDAGGVSQVKRKMARKDGAILTVEARARRPSHGQTIISLHDITEQEEAQRKIDASNARLGMLFQESLDAVFVADEKLAIIDFNQAALDLLGRSEKDVRGSSVRDFYSEESVKRVPLEIERVDRGELVENEREIQRPDGTVVPVNVRVRRLSDSTRVLVLRDISERVERERALRDRETELRQAHDLAQLGTFSIDLKEKRITLPDKFIALFDVPGAVLDLADWEACMHPDDVEEVRTARVQAAQDKLPYELEFRVVRSDGDIVTIHVWDVVDEDSDGNATFVRGIIQDVTAQRALEQALRDRDEQLRQSQRLESLGLLAGGIAHDFNNILAAVMGNAGYLQMTLSGDEPALEVVGEIERAATKGAELVGQLVAFSRSQELQPRIVEVDVAVADFLNMTRPIMGSTVRVETDVADDLWTARMDPTQLDQVLMNLVVNARDAMPGGGTVTIGLRNQKLVEEEAARIGAEPGEYVLLSVTDTGEGMEPDVVAHVFDPFYSTKAPHKGTGLGLSTVHGIVSQSGGHISVVSDPGVGSAFTVLMPRASEEPAG